MTREEVKNRLQEAITDNIPELEDFDFEETTSLAEHSNIDSLGFIMVLTDLENELGVTVPDEEWPTLRTFGDVVDAFMARMS